MNTIYVIGYPKSGSTWLARLLGDILDSPVGSVHPPSDSKCIATEGERRTGSYHIRQGHSSLTPGYDIIIPDHLTFAYEYLTDEKIVFVHRDPRDVIVSGAYHLGYTFRDYLLRAAEGSPPMIHGGGMVPFVRTWLHSGLLDVVTSYESLHEDTVSELSYILGELAVHPVHDLQESVHRQSFDVRKAWTKTHGDSLNYGEQFQSRFLRKGIVGDWRNHFDDDLRTLAQEHFGELIVELDYDES